VSYALYSRLNVHVGESDVAVIRKVRRKIKKSCRTKRKFRNDRHKLYRSVLKEHHAALKLFRHYRF
jgi:hypothetical protein